MFKFFIISLFASALADNWAVLVAGSNTFWNYRHQADIYHTYKILTEKNFDPNKIIVMSYDDVVNDWNNPFKGHIYNKPDGPDVYIGKDKIDYRRDDVVPAMFYAVLTGNKTATDKKVLESTENDDVFVFFDDHGAPDLIEFPCGYTCYADELMTILNVMHEKKMYKNLLFYVESCYSGSMFLNHLPDNLNIYVVTAAAANESSYTAYCDDERYKTCLSNEFSQSWMVQSESTDLSTITVGDQYEHAKEETVDSHVSEFGTTSIKSKKLEVFQSNASDSSSFSSFSSELLSVIKPIHSSKPVRNSSKTYKSLKQEDVYMHYLELAAKNNKFGKEAQLYNSELIKREKFNKQAKKLAEFFGQKYPDPNNQHRSLELSEIPLYRKAIQSYEKYFGKLNDHNLWSHTVILHRAIAEWKLTSENFDKYESLLKRL